MVSTVCLNYNGILASSQSLITRFAGFYERDYDKRQDLEQKIRYKIWTSLQKTFSTAKGTVGQWVYGVIKLESKKHVLDKHKYKQNFFEDSHTSLDILPFVYSSAAVNYLHSDLSEERYQSFVDDFCKFLNSHEKKIFDAMEEAYCSSDSLILLALVEDLEMEPSTLYFHAKRIEKKMEKFAKSRGFLIK